MSDAVSIKVIIFGGDNETQLCKSVALQIL